MIHSVSEALPKIQITRTPAVDFGISVQAPDSFHMTYSIVSNHSYINPFLSLDKSTLSKIKTKKLQCKQYEDSSWTSRQNFKNNSHLNNDNGFLTNRNDQNIATSTMLGLNKSMELNQSFQTINNYEKSKLFHKKKGQFTTYLENHLQNTDFCGPMLGDQRSLERKIKNKEKLLLKKYQALQMTKQKYKYVKPNRSPSPLIQKTKIHRSRLRLNQDVHQKYQQKENVRERSKQFELPKINKNELQNSFHELKSNYKKYKNESLNKSYFTSSLSSVKTADFDKLGLINKLKVR